MNQLTNQTYDFFTSPKKKTQTFISIDSQISQLAPSVLAMSSMAVAIDGLCMVDDDDDDDNDESIIGDGNLNYHCNDDDAKNNYPSNTADANQRCRLGQILAQIHESTEKVNEVSFFHSDNVIRPPKL